MKKHGDSSHIVLQFSYLPRLHKTVYVETNVVGGKTKQKYMVSMVPRFVFI